MKRIINITALLLLVTIVGCGKVEKKDQVKFPKGLLLTEKPAKYTTMLKATGNVKVGDDIVIMGLVGDKSNKPFVNNSAFFTITDKIGEKSCCNNCDTSKGYTAGVQVLDANGKIIKKSLEGFNGLKVGDNVIIKGKVNKMTTDTSLQLTATGIYIDK